jgi:fructose 1,6-bisphosphatase
MNQPTNQITLSIFNEFFGINKTIGLAFDEQMHIFVSFAIIYTVQHARVLLSAASILPCSSEAKIRRF